MAINNETKQSTHDTSNDWREIERRKEKMWSDLGKDAVGHFTKEAAFEWYTKKHPELGLTKEDIGIERDSFLARVVDKLAEAAAKEGAPLYSIFLEDIIADANMARPWDDATKDVIEDALNYLAEGSYLVCVGAGNDFTSWGEMEELCHLRGDWVSFGFESAASLYFADNLIYAPNILITESGTEGRSIWLFKAGYHNNPTPLIAEPRLPLLNKYCCEGIEPPTTKEAWEELQAEFIADMLFNKKVVEGISVRIDADAYRRNENNERKLFMGLDECKLDSKTIAPFVIEG